MKNNCNIEYFKCLHLQIVGNENNRLLQFVYFQYYHQSSVLEFSFVKKQQQQCILFSHFECNANKTLSVKRGHFLRNIKYVQCLVTSTPQSVCSFSSLSSVYVPVVILPFISCLNLVFF